MRAHRCDFASKSNVSSMRVLFVRNDADFAQTGWQRLRENDFSPRAHNFRTGLLERASQRQSQSRNRSEARGAGARVRGMGNRSEAPKTNASMPSTLLYFTAVPVALAYHGCCSGRLSNHTEALSSHPYTPYPSYLLAWSDRFMHDSNDMHCCRGMTNDEGSITNSKCHPPTRLFWYLVTSCLLAGCGSPGRDRMHRTNCSRYRTHPRNDASARAGRADYAPCLLVVVVVVVVDEEPSLSVVVVVEVVVTPGLPAAGRIIGSSTHLPVYTRHMDAPT